MIFDDDTYTSLALNEYGDGEGDGAGDSSDLMIHKLLAYHDEHAGGDGDGDSLGGGPGVRLDKLTRGDGPGYTVTIRDDDRPRSALLLQERPELGSIIDQFVGRELWLIHAPWARVGDRHDVRGAMYYPAKPGAWGRLLRAAKVVALARGWDAY